MDRLLTLGLIYSLFLLALLPINYAIWVFPGENIIKIKVHLVFVASAFIVCFATVTLAARLTPRTSDLLLSRLRVYLETKRYFIGAALVLLAVVWPLLTADKILDRFINSGDEFSYVFQACGLAEGRLWYEAPPLENTFVAWRTWVMGDKWVGQYPPGWPFFLAAGQLAGVPLWAVNALLGGLIAAVFLVMVWRWTSAKVALIATAVLVSSPFYLFNAASYHSHITAALCLLLFAFLYNRHTETGKLFQAFLSGAFLGILGCIRYFSALLAGVGLLGGVLLNRKVSFKGAALLALGGLPFLGLLLYYHFAVTGDLLKTTYSVIAWKKETQLTSNLGQWTNGARVSVQEVLSLSEWTSPIVLLVYAISLLSKIHSRSCKSYDFIFPAFVIGYMFYPNLGGNRYGPRYYFDAYPLMILTIATSYNSVMNLLKGCSRSRFIVHGIAASLIYSILTYPFAAYRYHSIVWERQDVYRLAQTAQLKNAVVFVKSDTGEISSMRSWDLARNKPELKESVLFANYFTFDGSKTDIEAVRRQFPTRSLWIYERQPGNPQGQLRPVD